MSSQKPSARASAPKSVPFEEVAARVMKTPYPDELREGPFPFAYAIIEGPPGKWSAVCLEGVTARKVQRIEPNGQPEPQARAMMRVIRAIEVRTIAKKWRQP